MQLCAELLTLARNLAGEFENQQQAIADPAWYVHLRLWQRPLSVRLFPEPGISFFAEQANTLKLDQSYRPRIWHLWQESESPDSLVVQYYMPKNIGAWRGAGLNPTRLETLTRDQLEFLPECRLNVTWQKDSSGCDRFFATLPPNARCCFSYQGETRQVALGFETGLVESQQMHAIELLSYDKGIDPITGQALWGAILGPYHFFKQQDYDLPQWG